MAIFTKINQSRFKDSLICEAEGLELLKQIIDEQDIPHLKIPEVKFVNQQELQITRIESSSASNKQMRQLGRGLALLHNVPQKHFGFEKNNYIGLSVQGNVMSQNWGEFFVQHRLEYQIELIKDQVIKNNFAVALGRFRGKLIDFLNVNSDQPSLVHGDLWSGNVLFDKSDVWLIDPAAYYADREVDVAMTEMFGGFSQDFYQTYNETRPLSPVYQQKKIIYNLYHYLNHYNLLGSGYLSACRQGFNLIDSLFLKN